MAESLHLVAAEVEDLAIALEFVAAYFGHDGLEFDGHVSAAVGQLLGDPSLGRFWFISADGARVGYLVMTFGFDHEFGGRIGLVTDFYLVEGSRGQGNGAAAIGLAIDQARSMGLGAVELYVLDHNQRARSFYRRFGFEDVNGRAPMSLRLR